jgi:heat shock protein HslJ
MRTGILILSTALIAGCGTATGGTEPVTGQATTGSPTGVYEVVDVSGEGRPSDTARITLTFGPGTLAAATGCNTITGRTALDGDRLTVSDPSTTDLPCPEGYVVVQEWLAAFLGDRPAVTVDGSLLTLTTTRATMRLRSTGPAAPDTVPGSGHPSSAPRTT